MPVLKDMRCIKCSATQEAVVDGEDTGAVLYCAGCKKQTVHQSRCNGGMNSRYRFMDFSGLNPEGYVEYLGCKAGIPNAEERGTRHEAANAAPATDKQGVIHDRARFGAEERAHRREKRKYAARRKRGSAPIHMDTGKK